MRKHGNQNVVSTGAAALRPAPGHSRRALAGWLALAIAAAVLPLIPTPAAAAPPPRYLTLLFGRTQWQAVDSCDAEPLPGTVPLDQVAAELAARGLRGTGAVVTNPTQETGRYCQPGIANYASWSDMAMLRDTYGWNFVSTGAAHADMTTLTREGQYAESCGSLAPLEARGHTRAWGLFGWGNNKYTEQIQQDVVSTCFAYGRRYVTPTSPFTNSRAATVAPWLVWALSVNGGACNDVALPCYDQAALGVNRRYMSPTYLAKVMSPTSDQWSIVQMYRFVVGSRSGPGPAWDCTDADWRKHWANQAEIYCFGDYLTAVSQIPSDVVVTDPATVSDAWGRGAVVPDTAAPDATMAAPLADEVLPVGAVALGGSASDDRAVAAVNVWIKDRATNLFWRSDGTWGALQWLPATVTEPGALTTAWSFSWPAPGPGQYSASVRARDGQGNLDTTQPLVRFAVADDDRTGVVPSAMATLGGPLHYDLYPSGLEVAPGGSLIVADTGNNLVKRYSPAGALEWTTGAFGSGDGQFDNPRDVGIDSAGNAYVIDSRNSRIVKLGPSGQWLGSWRGPAGDEMSFPLGLSVHDDLVYLADLGRKKVRVFDTAGNQLRAFGPNGACANFDGIRDADADSAGNIYVAGYATNTIMKLTSTGTCLTTWGGTGTGNGKFRTPYGVRVAVDPVLGTEAVYVADARNNRVQEFLTDGTFVAKFGTTGTFSQPGTFTTMRRVAVATDGTGDVWGADLWGNRLVRFHRTSTGYQYAQTIGTAPPPTTDSAVFHEPRQVAFSNDGTLNVVDTVHHRIVRMTPGGHIVGTCGVRGSDPGQFNWPRGVAVDPATGQLWVADTKQNQIQIIRPDCTPVQRLGTPGTGAGQFDWPYSIAIRASDRIAWVADTQNDRIRSYDVATRAVIANFGSVGSGLNQFMNPAGIAVDPATGHVWVADTGNNRIVELEDTGGSNIRIVRTIAGPFHGPEALAVDPTGRILVADSDDDEITVLAPGGLVDVVFGESEGLRHPSGVAIDPTGRLYISDTYNDRIAAYGDGPPPPDTVAPNGTVTVPGNNQSLPVGPVVFSGSASDNVGVTQVKVAVKNRTTGKWWHADGTWGAFTAFSATLAAPGAPATGWTYTWLPPASGSYAVWARAADGAGNLDPSPVLVNFTVTP